MYVIKEISVYIFLKMNYIFEIKVYIYFINEEMKKC